MGPRGVVSPAPGTVPVLLSGQIYNLGTGTGYSVLQMVVAMEKASGKKVGWQPTLTHPQPLPLTYMTGIPAPPCLPKPALGLDA